MSDTLSRGCPSNNDSSTSEHAMSVLQPTPDQARQRVHGTRTGRTWVAVCAGALITVALIIFMLQNTHTVQVNFFGLTGSTSLALMLLIAAVGGILLTLIIGSARILQLRHAVRTPR